MKKLLVLLSIILCLSASPNTFAAPPAPAPGITLEEALSIAQKEFEGQDVDYYLVDDNNDDIWTIFVDAQPLANWGHDCYLLTVSKKILASIDTNKPLSKRKMMMPPGDNLLPLSIKDRYEGISNLAPIINIRDLSHEQKELSKRTYAIILSGGGDKDSNHERYWNDCSFIYKTLTKGYGIPKSNIYPIMSDGDNLGIDMRLANSNRRISQPPDLDGDNLPEIKLAASKSNIKTALNEISLKIKADDQLFFYVIDHGGRKNGKSYIVLWQFGAKGKEAESDKYRLYSDELAEYLQPFTSRNIKVNAVLGQCFSGGFINDLTKEGCVVATACKEDEVSWACLDKIYDEFVYYWTSAINGVDHLGRLAQADNYPDGKISMSEAFIYARENDPHNFFEHPQYSSTPVSLGDDLSFDYLPSCDDLFIKDNIEDTGKEPNITTEIFFESPSIWVRNQKDGIEKHENPVFSQSHRKAFIYVKVENRGWKDYSSGKWLHVYCSKASTGLSKAAWKGDEIYDENGLPTGMHLTPIQIPAIMAGGSQIIEVEWNLPEELLDGIESNNTEKHHFCILARVVPDPEDNFDPTGYFDVLADNNTAQKNVSIISYTDLNQNTKVFVRNISDDSHNYSLELKPRTTTDANIYNLANIELGMPLTLYYSWQTGGCETNGIAQPAEPGNLEATEATEAHAVFTFASPESAINSIYMDAAQLDPVSLKFNFHDTPVIGKTYTLDLIQRDENGKIVGGETFYVESPVCVSPVDTTVIGIDPIPFPGGITLSAKAPQNSKLTWFDSNNKKLGENATLNVTAPKDGATYKLTSLNEQGELAKAEITLDNTSAIKNISIDASGSALEIEFTNPVKENSEIKILDILSGDLKLTEMVASGERKISIDVSSLSGGSYALSFIVNNHAIESKKFNK